MIEMKSQSDKFQSCAGGHTMQGAKNAQNLTKEGKRHTVKTTRHCCEDLDGKPPHAPHPIWQCSQNGSTDSEQTLSKAQLFFKGN